MFLDTSINDIVTSDRESCWSVMKLMSYVKGITLSTYYINYWQSPPCIAYSHSAVTCPTHFVPVMFAVFSSSLYFTLYAKCSPLHPVLRHPQSGFLP